MNERQLKEIAWALLYQRLFSHGTDGHNRLTLAAQLAGEAGYQLQLCIETYVDRGSKPGIALEAGASSCRFLLTRGGQMLLELADLIEDGKGDQ